MKTKIPLKQLLHWRLAQAEEEAPPAPRAARLLEQARPWWERLPEQFQSLAQRVRDIRIVYGHAMAEPQSSRTGHPVPALIVRTVAALEASASVLYFEVREGRLRLRFKLEIPGSGHAEPSFEVTFISENTGRPLFPAPAAVSVDSEYRIDAELSEELALEWARVRVTDRMPFRLILHPEAPAV